MRSPICLFFPFEQFQTMLCFGWKKEGKKTREGGKKKKKKNQHLSFRLTLRAVVSG